MNDLFFVDGQGSRDLSDQSDSDDSDDNELDFNGIDLPLTNIQIQKSKKCDGKVKSGKNVDLRQLEIDLGWKRKHMNASERRERVAKNLEIIEKEVNPLEKVLEKSAIVPGFEALKQVPRYDESRRQHIAESRRDREKTKGKKWFNLPKTEMTEEVKHDLEVIQMRSVLDPKHFYKKNDIKALPKYFQIGKVLDSPAEYYNGRLTKKERKRTIVEELMADAEFSKYNKRKYKEIIDEKKKLHYKAHRHAKKLKGKRK